MSKQILAALLIAVPCAQPAWAGPQTLLRTTLTPADRAAIESPRVSKGFTPSRSIQILPMKSGPYRAPVPAGPGTPASCGGACKMDYFGGHVIPNVKVYAVMWSSAVNPEVISSIGGYYQAVTNNDFMDWLNEYNTTINASAGSRIGAPGTQQLVGRGTFGGLFTLTPTLVVPPGTTSLSDAQITAELDAQINAGTLPVPDANTIYMLYFPAGTSIAGPGGSGSCTTFCAYHGTYLRGPQRQSVFYAIQPDFYVDCAAGCGPGAAFQNLCSASSHELIEATTDAEVGLVTGSSYDYPSAFGDLTNGEVGDMCNQHEDTITSLTSGATYTVQQEFSQRAAQCVTTRTDPQDFKLWMLPNTASLVAGSVATVDVPVNTGTTAGGGQALALSVSGRPANVTGTLGSASVTSGSNTTVTLSAASATAATVDGVVVVEAAGTTRHTASLLLRVVVPANDFSIAATPAAITVPQGGSSTVSVSTTVVKGAAESVTLSTGALPTGVTASFAPPTVNAGATSVMTVSATTAAALAASQVTVYGTSASTRKLATFQVTVQPGISAYVLSGLPATTAAGAATSFTVTAKDLGGATATNYNGTALLTSTDRQATLAATVTFVSGVASNVPVTFKTAGSQSVTVTSPGMSSITATGTTTVSVGALARYGFTGLAASVAAGTATSFSVNAQDAYGNAITSYAGTARFTSTDARAAVPPNATFVQGVAANQSITFKSSGTQSITATDAMTASLTGSAPTTVVAGPVSQYTVDLPATATAGVRITFTLHAQDAFGNPATAYQGTAALVTSDPSATLANTSVFVAGNSVVPVTFLTSGSQTVTAHDASSPSVTVTGTTVVAAGPAKIYVLSGLPAAVGSGNAVPVTVTAKDTFGNVATAYAGPARVISSDNLATLPSSPPFTAGVASMAVTFQTLGAQTLTATDVATASLTVTGNTTVASGKAVRYVLSGLPATVMAGAPATFTVTAKDAQGGVATSYTGSGKLTSSDTGAALPASLVFTAGVAANQIVSLKSAGNQTITATDRADATLTATGTLNVLAGPAAQYVISGLTPKVIVSTPVKFTVTALDREGNTATDYAGRANVTSSDTRSTLPASPTFTAGVASNVSITFGSGGSQTVTATDTVTPAIKGLATVTITAADGGPVKSGCGCGTGFEGGSLSGLFALVALLRSARRRRSGKNRA